ncbi:Flp pilus assembly protein CpaB [Aquabacterium sp.]|uniref:Flp pilus assembly protein CpaB n=1 Tax=Aquabacterium sp. TaxID=1872578 RepID=UPI0019C77BCC|nr:Flp pilus assembly protein CpaB [Aquabacterium sp.]MBC7699453.1 Flp pilus assembly protein CpaB [Aquabacterium sp.]
MKLPLPKMKFKPSKAVVVLGVAIAIGLLAALAARNYLSNRVEAIDAQARGKMIDLVVAKIDLDKGATLTNENVAVRSIPVEYAHEAAISPGSFDRADGEKLAYPLKAGQLLMWGLLETKRVPTFSARIDVGHRAMTVPVDEISSISGMLEPGDVIDLIVTVDRDGKKTTFPLLQSVPVLATGQRSIDDPKSGERREFSTVTLDTTPEQAQHVIMAREGGMITALLRNPQDQQKIGDQAVDIASMLGSKSLSGSTATTPSGAGTDEGVPVLYGGGGKFTPEQLNMGGSPRLASAKAMSKLDPVDKPFSATTNPVKPGELLNEQAKALVSAQRSNVKQQ